MHIYLIGYRGSGKSTVGRRLAEKLKRPLVDSDDLIELQSCMSIKDIFAEKGEPWFRDLEASVVREVSANATQPTIFSLGGGAVLRESTQQVLKSSGRCVWLRASAEYLYQRIQTDQATQLRRPNLSQSGGFAEVSDLLEKRTPIYQQLSDQTISVEAKTPDEICDEIVGCINSNGWMAV